MTKEEFLGLEPIFRTMLNATLILLALILLIRIIQYVIYIRKKRVDYWNNKPINAKWWQIGLSSIFGFLWFVFVTKPNK